MKYFFSQPLTDKTEGEEDIKANSEVQQTWNLGPQEVDAGAGVRGQLQLPDERKAVWDTRGIVFKSNGGGPLCVGEF